MSLKNSILWGVNAHHKGFRVCTEELALELVKLAAELGSTIYRINYNPRDDEMIAYITRIIDACHDYGMKVMLVLDQRDRHLVLQK